MTCNHGNLGHFQKLSNLSLFFINSSEIIMCSLEFKILLVFYDSSLSLSRSFQDIIQRIQICSHIVVLSNYDQRNKSLQMSSKLAIKFLISWFFELIFLYTDIPQLYLIDIQQNIIYNRMEKTLIDRIKQRIRQHGETYKITQLCMDELPIQQFSSEILKQLQKCINVEYVTFEHCDLKSLDNLPRFPKLQSLQLGYNKIPGGSIHLLTKYSNLVNLSLQENSIASIEDLRPLQSCKQLTRINLIGNGACIDNYRAQLFALLPQLSVVDGFNKSGQAIKEQSSSDGESEFSDSEISLSDEQQQRQSPTKSKRKN